MHEEIEEGQLVLCTVDRISGTTIFVRLDNYEKEGTIITAEIAPGRIRNIRDYVVPGKKIVCTVLRVDKKTGNIELSLRRVTSKESSEILLKYKKEVAISAMLKTLFGKEKAADIVKRIKQKHNLLAFFEKVEEEKLKELDLSNEECSKLFKILKEKPEEKVNVKAKIKISCEAENGITIIKDILKKIQTNDIKINYISAPNYLVNIEAKDYKEANKKKEEILQKILQEAKNKGCKAEILK